MLKPELHGREGLLTVTVKGPLRAEDFEELAADIDPYLEEHGALQGLMILAPEFPDWEDFDALLSQFRFVRDHHERIRKVALVSESVELMLLESLGKHFVDAEVEQFDLDERDEARAWLLRREETD